jgi:hypothetical protein
MSNITWTHEMTPVNGQTYKTEFWFDVWGVNSGRMSEEGRLELPAPFCTG